MSPDRSNPLGGVDVRVEVAVVWTREEQTASMATLTTHMTRLRGGGGIDRDHRHTRILCLGGDESPQLVEAPTVVLVSLGLSDLGSLPLVEPIRRAVSAAKSHAAANALSVASMSRVCSGVGASLQTTVRVVSIKIDSITSVLHIKEENGLKPWKIASSTAAEAAWLPRAKAPIL
jgi:hypothetical protein